MFVVDLDAQEEVNTKLCKTRIQVRIPGISRQVRMPRIPFLNLVRPRPINLLNLWVLNANGWKTMKYNFIVHHHLP
jgi:hypothetical protein